MTKTCPETQRSLHAHLDGELPAAERERLDGHLAECAACRAALEDLRTLAAALEALPAEPAPEGAVERLLARVAAVEQLIPARPHAGLSPVFGVVLAAASLLFGLFLGGRLGRPAPVQAEPPEILLAAVSTMELLPAGSPAADILIAVPQERR